VPVSPYSWERLLSYLKKLQDAQTLKGVADLLGFKANALSYVLYKMPDAQKYTCFEIPKRTGGTREIRAPTKQLKLLQRRLANVLYICVHEVESANKGRRSLAHGFERNRSIVTNARLHKRRRYVLNLDLEDFFPSINFGRVRGFFIKDKHFALNEKVATVIAQIACHDNELPQGSPSSPIISNLIAHLLDAQLARFAKLHKCTYSRYADDITLSTNRKDFPEEVAARVPGTSSQWQLGNPLVSKIENAGFQINDKKTRMQCRGSRQVTTGLLVNEKVNIRPEYYRTARAMCHALFSTGTYYRLVPATLVDGAPEDAPIQVPASTLGQLEGILAHIHYVKFRTAKEKNRNKPPSAQMLYHRFLFYKNFVALEKPLIIPEGKTDAIYLRTAIKMLEEYHSCLGQFVNGNFSTNIRFLNFTRTVHEILHHGHGVGNLVRLIAEYKQEVEDFGHTALVHPVILLIDNDDGAVPIFKQIKKLGGPSILHKSKDDFYHFVLNLYLVKTPEIGTKAKSRIEDLFDPDLLKTKIDGKTFDPNKEHDAERKYGKFVFAEKVIKPNADRIDFSKFKLLLNRIVAVLDDYEKQCAARSAG
jgi:RNA-directed DNA polymerase